MPTGWKTHINITYGEIFNMVLFSFPFYLSMICEKGRSHFSSCTKTIGSFKNKSKFFVLFFGCKLGVWTLILGKTIKQESPPYIKRVWINFLLCFGDVTPPLNFFWGPRKVERIKNCQCCWLFCFLYSYLVPAIRNNLNLFLTVKCCPVGRQHFIWAYKI